MKEVHQDVQNYGIKTEDIGNRKALRKKFAKAKDTSEEELMRSIRVFSEEERARASERMKEYWRKR